MKIFVIIVTYNPYQWINKCFSSLRQSVLPVQTIVIDNASKDGSQQIIQTEYPEVDFIASDINVGFGAANNIGIKKAYELGADFIFLLNQDAWIEPDTISKLVKVANQNENYGIISPLHYNGHGNALDYNFSTFLGADRCPGIISDFIIDNPLKEIYQLNFVNAAAWLLPRKCIEIVGGFNPSFFHYAEDLNYADRVNFHDLKIGIVPSAKIFHDRQSRGQNIFLQDDKLHFSRVIIKELSKPKIKKSLRHFYLVTIKNILKYGFKGDVNSLQLENSRLMVLWKTDIKTLKRNRKESLKRGFAFLDLG